MCQKWTVLLSSVLLLAVAVGAGDGARSPVARVLEAKGKATIVDPDNFDRPAAVFGILYADDRLTVDKDSSVILVFKADGHMERAAVAGTLKLTQNGCQPKTSVEQMAMSEQNRTLVGKISKGPRGIVQGGGAARAAAPQDNGPSNDSRRPPLAPPGRLRPIPESTLLTIKPTFSWPAVPRAWKYTLNLYCLGNRVWSTTTETTQVKYPGEPLLQPGATYSWDVTITLDNKTNTICEGVFHTVTDQQRAEAEGLEKLIAKPEVPNLALAAMWYKQKGLVTEAIAAHQQLAKLSGDPAAYWALSELCWRAGREEDARNAEEKAAQLEKKAGAR
jgi:hypothetical protein